MALTALFDIGKSGIFVYRKSLEVTSHNIANAATDGYTRQDVIFQNIASGVFSYAGTSGRGVQISEIRRMYDAFIELQLKTESSNYEYWNVFGNGMLKLESIFNDASDVPLSNAVSDFFNAWQELSQNPAGFTERTLLLDKSEYLVNRIKDSYTSLMNERNEIYKDSQNMVNQVNEYIDQINKLNERIIANPGALDAMDQRDYLLKQLNDIVKVTYFEDNVGRYSILIGGIPLVDAGTVYKLSVQLDSNNEMQFEVEAQGGGVDVTNLISGGKLKAEIDLRDSEIPRYMDKMNMLVFDLTEAINAQHRQGYGLDGSTGENFFSQLYDIIVNAGSYDDIIVKLTDTNENTYDEYQIEFDGANWTVINNTTSSSVTPTVTSWTEGTDTYYKLSFNDMEITLKNPTSGLDLTYQIKSNTSLYFDVAITDTDKIAAAGQDPTGPNSGVMDNENARAIYALFDKKIVGSYSTIDFYRSIVSEVGVYTASANTQKSYQSALIQSIEQRKQELSGVSLDEEAINLIKYQKMYEASARVIKVADDILATLFDMVG